MLRQVPIGLLLERCQLHDGLTERDVHNWDPEIGTTVNCWGHSFTATMIEGGGQSVASSDWYNVLFREAIHISYNRYDETITLQAMRSRFIDASPYQFLHSICPDVRSQESCKVVVDRHGGS